MSIEWKSRNETRDKRRVGPVYDPPRLTCSAFSADAHALELEESSPQVTRGDVQLLVPPSLRLASVWLREAGAEVALGPLASVEGKKGEMVMRGWSSGARRARDASLSSGSMGVAASAGGNASPVRSDSGSGPWHSSFSRQPTAPK